MPVPVAVDLADVVVVVETLTVVVVVVEALTVVVVVEALEVVVVVETLEVVVVVEALEVVVVVETLEVVVVVEALEVVVVVVDFEVEDDAAAAPISYMLMRLDPPQYSEELPLQTMLHPEAPSGAGVLPFEIALPQSFKSVRPFKYLSYDM